MNAFHPKRLRIPAAGAVALASLLALTGCSDDSPVAPDRGVGGGGNAGNVTVSVNKLDFGIVCFGQDKTLACPDAADANDDGKIGLTDAIYMLSYLFLPEGRKPPAKPPFGPLPGGCGEDPTPDGLDAQFSKTGRCVYPSCP